MKKKQDRKKSGKEKPLPPKFAATRGTVETVTRPDGTTYKSVRVTG